MASIVLGAAGAFVGSFFGPLGASIGWMLGSAIGNALSPQHQEGPRLADLKLQVSEYGRMIPLPYGVGRIAGNVVWQTDLVEHKHSQGGKGGGPTVTSYTYSASFAVQLCAGPIITFLRIWADGRLIYDQSSDIGQSLQVTFYPGDETQGPDPTMELDLGVGNVPGYRGTALLVFPDLPLTDYGNRIPNLEVEVVTSASGTIPWRYSSFTRRDVTAVSGSGGVEPFEGGLAVSQASPGSTSYGSWFNVRSYDLHGNEKDIITDVLMPAPDPTNISGSFTEWFCCINSIHIVFARQTPGFFGVPNSAWYVDGVRVATPVNPFLAGAGVYGAVVGDDATSFKNAYLYAICFDGSQYAVARYPAPAGVPAASPDLGYVFTGVVSGPVFYDSDDAFIYMRGDGDVYKFDAALNLVHTWHAADRAVYDLAGDVVPFGNTGAFHGGRALNVSLVPGLAFSLMEVGTPWTYIGQTVAAPAGSAHMRYLFNGLVSTGDGIVSMVPPPGAITLASIVNDLSLRAGLDPLEIDVAQLSELVHFYVVTQQMSARTAIEPLQSAFFFDAVESSGVAKFVKRGQASVITIPDDDLGTHAKGETPPPLITYTRGQEEDLPRSITVKYKNIEADYQPGAQSEPRQVTLSKLDTTLEFAIAMYDLEAKQKAAALLFNAWLERDRFVLNTPRKYDHLEPTDVIVAHGYPMRLNHRDDVQKGVLSFEALGAGAYVWTQGSVAGSGPGSSQGITPQQTTTLQLLDIPLIDDSDTPGFYAAAAGASATAWPGETLYKSTDGGTTFSSIDSETVPSSIGTSSSTLGDFFGGNVFDKLNSVTVVLAPGAGALSSAAESAVLNGANTALLGDEIIAFQTATLTAPSTYLLSDMLRGRRGTEWAMPGHGPNERFIMLPVPAIALSTAEIGLPRKYKAVTSGALLSSALVQTFNVAGLAWRPYAPVHLGGGRNAAGDVTLNWVRRTRLGGGWRGPSNVPLGETSEAYVVQIWDATYTQCARIITGLTSPTAVYTSAQQVTDFGAQQQHIYFTVGQVGTYALGAQAHGVAAGAGGSDVAPLAPITPYGVAPPVISNGCTLPVPVTTVMSGPINRYFNPDWHEGEVWLLQFTTGASGTHGRVAVAEYGGPGVTRTGTLSDSPCGQGVGPGSFQQGSTVTWTFFVGSGNPYPQFYPTLQPSTTYYVSVTTASASGASADYSTL